MSRPQEFELRELTGESTKANGSGEPTLKQEVDGTVAVWTYTSAVLLSLFSAVLIISPGFLLFIIGETRTVPTSLEAFLALHFGIFLFAITVSLLSNIPSADALPSRTAPLPWHPLLVPLTSAGLLMSLLSWNTWDIGSLSVLYSMSTGLMGLWGLWTMMFADQSSVSKTTGTDKHTSAFIFGNQSSASRVKKAWKRSQ